MRKQLLSLFVTIITLLSFTHAHGQISFSDSYESPFVVTLNQTGTDANGYNIFQGTGKPSGGSTQYRIFLVGNLWTIQYFDGGSYQIAYYSTNATKPNPPALGNGTWIAAGPDNLTQLSGTSTTATGPVSISSFTAATSSGRTNAATVAYNIVLSGNVTGLSLSNFSATTSGISGASFASITGSGSAYTVTLNTGTGDGFIRLNLANATNVSPSITGLPYNGAVPYSVDKTSPTVVITSAAGASGATTTTSPIPFTVTFSEAVTGFVAGDLTYTNGAVSNFSGSGTTYTFDLTPNTANTASTVNVAANVAQDTHGNGNTAATQFTSTYNIPTATVISVTRLNPSPTATNTVNYRVVFSAAVSGVTTSNFSMTTTGSVSGNSISSVSGSGTTYTVTVNTGSGNGTLRLNVADPTGISSTVTNTPYTAGEAYTITKSFSAAPQLTIQGTGGTGSDVTAFIDNVQVLAGGIPSVNALQNGSFETHNAYNNNGELFAYNPTGASWTFNANSGIANAGSAFSPTTPVPNGIAVAMIQSNGGGNGQIQQNIAVPTGNNYQVSFQASQRICCTTLDQSLNVFLNGVFSGNIQPGTNGYSNFTSAVFSVTAPALTTTISSTANNPTGVSTIPVSATFSQAVTGLAVSDFVVANGAINNFTGSDASYTFNLTPTTSGNVSVTLAANSVLDANNTPNTETSFSIVYNQPTTAAPVVLVPANGSMVTTTTPTYIGTAVANSTVTLYVDGASIAATTATAGGEFSLVQPITLAQGSHTVSATAQTNGATVSANSNTNTFTVDNVRPTLVITSSAASPTSISPIPFTITFSENVTGFVTGDITITNGIAASLTGSGTTYTLTVTPTTSGTVTVSVPAAVAQDAAALFNEAATPVSITYIQVLPVTLFSYTAIAVGNAVKLTWTTSSERDNDRFEIERSTDGIHFNQIGKVKSGGSASIKQNYNWYDRSPLNGTNYYRLLQVDKDGQTTALGIKPVSFALADLSASIYPNPASKEVTVQFPQGADKIAVLDVNGKVILNFKVATSATKTVISVATFPSGSYFVQISTPYGVISKKLIKL